MNKAEFNRRLASLAYRYLDPHLTKTGLTPEEEDDIRSFCLLAHAALEEFIESFADEYRTRLVARWQCGVGLRKAAVISLISLLSSQGKGALKIDIELDESNAQEAPIHQIAARLQASVKAHETLIDNNHGAAKGYIRSLFVPLGFGDISDHAVLDAIGKLANNRGTYAHRLNQPTAGTRFVLNKLSASQLKSLIPDLERISDRLIEQANMALPGDYPPFKFEHWDLQ